MVDIWFGVEGEREKEVEGTEKEDFFPFQKIFSPPSPSQLGTFGTPSLQAFGILFCFVCLLL